MIQNSLALSCSAEPALQMLAMLHLQDSLGSLMM